MKINFNAPINQLSFGIASLNIFRELDKNHEVCWWGIGDTQVDNDDIVTIDMLKRCMSRQDEFPRDGVSFKLWHPNGFHDCIGRGLAAGYTFFELYQLSKREVHHLNSLDVLFVASKHASQVLSNNGVTKPVIKVAPLGVDRNIFNESVKPIATPGSDTVFLHVGKAEMYRKGLDVIYDAFNNEFKPSDKVKLILAIDNPFLQKEEFDKYINLFKSGKMGNKIQFIPRVSSQKQLASLYQYVDCGLFPSRAEAWCYPCAEMLSMGKHVIATNDAGMSEYITNENAYVIDIQNNQFVTANQPPFFTGQGQWRDIYPSNVLQVMEYMRDVHNRKQSGNLGINMKGIMTFKMYSNQNCYNHINNALTNMGVA